MPTSSANTTSADAVILSFRKAVAGDKISDETLDELVRRFVAEVDSSARASQTDESEAKVVSDSGTLAVGAQEITFSWSEAFKDTSYVVSLHPTGDPGGALRIWVKTKSTTRIVFGVAGHTVATNFSFVANAPK